MKSVTLAATLAFTIIPASLLAQSRPTYHVVKRVKLGGEGVDYLTVDPQAHRLYISRSTHVQVVDLDADTLVADIPNTLGVHGVALASELGKGFASDGRDSTVTVIDTKTLAVTGVVHGTGRNPDAILYDPTTRRVFTFNGGSASATAIDAATGEIVGTVPLGGKPEAGNHDGRGRIFVNIEDRNEIVAFHAKTLAVQAHWPMPTCDEPTGQAIDRAHHRLFVGCGGNKTMTVVDYEKGAVLATLRAGEGVDATAFDPETQIAFASGGDGTLTLVHQAGDQFHEIGSVPTMRGARTMALDPGTHRVYTVSAEFGPAPAPTAEQPRPRRTMVPGSFVLLVLEP